MLYLFQKQCESFLSVTFSLSLFSVSFGSGRLCLLISVAFRSPRVTVLCRFPYRDGTVVVAGFRNVTKRTGLFTANAVGVLYDVPS